MKLFVLVSTLQHQAQHAAQFRFNYRAHLNTAGEMLSKIRTAQEEIGEEFAFEDQVGGALEFAMYNYFFTRAPNAAYWYIRTS